MNSEIYLVCSTENMQYDWTRFEIYRRACTYHNRPVDKRVKDNENNQKECWKTIFR